MLLYLTNYLAEFESGFSVFNYLTLRAILGALTALAISFIIGPRMIERLSNNQGGQPVRSDGPDTHIIKAGTPTMGGALILTAIVVSTVLWADLENRYIWVVLFVTLAFGVIGYVDDYKKLILQDPAGLSARQKLFWQSTAALIPAVALFMMATDEISTSLLIPYFPDLWLPLGMFQIVISFLFIVGFSNAVNLTDGLDGLAIGPIIIATITFTGIVYLTGHFKFADYLNIQHIREAGELAVLTSAIVGASLGFLWYNTYPAQIFMGDVGSLSLGGVLGIIACISKQELLLIPVGGIFVIEALSVIIQVGYFKYTGGKRFFKMAPLHHHFEQLGWPEPKVIVRFWIVAAILAIASLSTLKLR